MNRNCKNCKSIIPWTAIINDKEYRLDRRKYCLVCVPMFSKNHYVIEKQNKPSEKECPICSRFFDYHKNDICSTCRGFWTRFINKQKCVSELGGRCFNCGNDDVDVLTFHHRDPNIKSFNICANLHNTKWDILKSELLKCDLLCMNCHMKIHKLEDKERKDKIKEYYESKKFNCI